MMRRGNLSDLALALAQRRQLATPAEASGALRSAPPSHMTFGQALTILRKLASDVDDVEDPRAAAWRLQERIAARRDAEELRRGLLELGARLLLQRLTPEDV